MDIIQPGIDKTSNIIAIMEQHNTIEMVMQHIKTTGQIIGLKIISNGTMQQQVPIMQNVNINADAMHIAIVIVTVRHMQIMQKQQTTQ